MNLYQSLCSVIFIVALGACSWQKKENKLDEGEPVRVQVPFSVDGKYRLGIVELFTLSNIQRLEGSSARFLLDPNTTSGQLRGRSPRFRYIRDHEGVIVAKDDFSLQLMTVYTHFEKLRLLDSAVGAHDVLKYPRTIAINVQVSDESGKVENNALYSAQHDALLIVPYTRQELPLMVNGGVIGHEHFHALFQKLFIAPLKDKYPESKKPTVHNEKALIEAMGLGNASGNLYREEKFEVSKTDLRERYHAALLRAINEGFADIWGWVYSGDNQFVGRSLPQEKVNRELEIIPQRLFPRNDLMFSVEFGEPDSVLLFKSYQHGTQLARTIRNFANLYAKGKNTNANAVRTQIGQILISTLSEMKKEYEALKDDELYTLSRAVAVFARQAKDIASPECYFLAKLMPQEDRQETGLDKDCRALEALENPNQEVAP